MKSSFTYILYDEELKNNRHSFLFEDAWEGGKSTPSPQYSEMLFCYLIIFKKILNFFKKLWTFLNLCRFGTPLLLSYSDILYLSQSSRSLYKTDKMIIYFILSITNIIFMNFQFQTVLRLWDQTDIQEKALRIKQNL